MKFYRSLSHKKYVTVNAIIKAKKGMRTQLLQFLKFKNEFVNLSVFKCSERSINTIKFWTPI